MTLRVFNTFGRKLEEFIPLAPPTVRLYTCGPTVYDYAHIGNFRAYVFEDVLRRYLKFKGYKVRQVMNITDVDDKTIRGARTEGIPLREYTDRYAKAFFDDIDSLKIERAEVYPRATDHVPEMVEMIDKLLKKGFAYRSESSAYYDISQFPAYGRLSGFPLGKLRRTGRISVDEYSKDEAADFALWKAWDPDDGEVYWETAIGKGRPGWSIECSAMSMKYLGESFDIHTGGVDNMFPHHENEIAQSEAATGRPFVRYWLHCEHLLVEGEKMSKSLGNIVTLRDLRDKGYSARALRYLLLSAHYRTQLNFTWSGLSQAYASVNRLQDFVDRVRASSRRAERNEEAHRLTAEALNRFETAMDDDLNTPKALAAIFDFIRVANRCVDTDRLSDENTAEILAAFDRYDSVLGVIGWARPELPSNLLELISEREEARRRKDFGRADEIRRKLLVNGIVLEDTPEGVRWKWK